MIKDEVPRKRYKTMPPIKACPLCGGKALHMESSMEDYTRIKCKFCNLTLEADSFDIAVRKWNRRLVEDMSAVTGGWKPVRYGQPKTDAEVMVVIEKTDVITTKKRRVAYYDPVEALFYNAETHRPILASEGTVTAWRRLPEIYFGGRYDE